MSKSHPIVRLLPWLFAAGLLGCKSPTEHRQEADRDAANIIAQKQKEAFGKTSPFSIEQPADILRRRLIDAQGLVHVGPESLGTDVLEPIEHWPEPDYPHKGTPPKAPWAGEEPYPLSLLDALKVGARNNRDYQSRKEAVFVAALDLDLARNNFRNIWTGSADALVIGDATSADDGGIVGTDVGVSRLLKTGALLAGKIGLDLVKLLSSGDSSFGLFTDLSIAIPLLRGSGKHIVAEPLNQAERDVVYALRDFERFRKIYAVDVAAAYLDVLQQADRVRNAEENYRGLIILSRRTRAMAAAGRLPGVQVDQARQNELSARDNWIASVQNYESRLDALKGTLGLPPDASIDLSPEEMERMVGVVRDLFEDAARAGEGGIETGEVPPADAAAEIPALDPADRGPYEMDEGDAVALAFDNRQDLLIRLGQVYDAQRKVVVAADGLRAGLDVEGRVTAGGARNLLASALLPDGQLDFRDALYTASLVLDLPFERTAERITYRESFIALESAVRSAQALEDAIKLAVREGLRRMLADREGVRIQVEAVRLAQDRVRSTNLFLEAGRAQVRDVLEAQEDLLVAQNALTDSLVSYRISTLEMQRDMGVLKVDSEGLWTEYEPDEQG
ncbi:MAG: TolC family protein [Planctomycetota bacterium]|jgi:outer membrane protein TolC